MSMGKSRSRDKWCWERAAPTQGAWGLSKQHSEHGQKGFLKRRCWITNILLRSYQTSLAWVFLILWYMKCCLLSRCETIVKLLWAAVHTECPRGLLMLFGNSGKVWSGCLCSSKVHLQFLFLGVELQSVSDRRREPHVPQRLGHRVCSVPPALPWHLWPPDQHEGCLKNNHVSFGSCWEAVFWNGMEGQHHYLYLLQLYLYQAEKMRFKSCWILSLPVLPVHTPLSNLPPVLLCIE